MPQSKRDKVIAIKVMRKKRQNILNKFHTTGITTKEMQKGTKLLLQEQALRKKLNPKEIEVISKFKRVR